MSHLPFDARSILEYLNELGYRNITAGQLKEFMKGMQSQSELNQSSKQRKSNNFNTTGECSRVSAKKSEQTQQRKHCKLVKGKRPLERYTFYLDIKDHQQSRKVEEVITKLGGSLDFFLTPNVTHFITDKEISPANNICNQNKNNNFVTRPKTPQTPATPETPLTPYSYDQTDGNSKPINNHNRLNAGVSGGSVGVCGVGGVTCSNNKFGKQSRADAMLNRARRSQNSFTSNEQQLHLNLSQQQQTILASNNKQQLQTALSYIIWDTDYALRFFTKVAFDLKKYLENSASKKVNGSLSSEKGACEPIHFKNNFIKIESIQRNCRPYYQLWKKVCDWPKIELMREDGAFRHSPPANRTRQPSTPKQKQNNSRKMTRKSRSSTNRHAAAASVRKINQEEKSCIPGQEQQTKKDQQQQSTDRQCGVCEICKIEYDALTIHLKTKDHEIFAKNTENFLALDSLIKTSASVNKFLDRSKKSHNPVVDISAKVKIENELETSNKDLDDGKPIEKRKSKRNGKGSKSFSEEQSPTIPKKSKLSPSKRSTSFIELKDIGVEANVNSPKKCNNKTNPTVSPPIRPMLPTSSLYKVVESKESYLLPKATGRLTNTQGTTASVGSPSLIVKIRKVRQTELSILNGEAENFMFPKSRISETPTDVDRHTTSENTRQSSSSLSSSDRASEIDIRTEETHTIQNEPQRASISAKRRLHKLNTNDCSNKKALILASNKSISDICHQQSFPNTPIQPVVTASSSPPPAPIDSFGKKRTKLSPKESSFFEVATRKSSRTSTAIVTAATNSSRLLRATVENCRRSNRSRKQRYRLPLEDGMGDSMKDGSEEDDEDHELDHGSDDDDDEDEDFVINVRKKATHTNKKSPKKSKQYPKIFDIKTGKQLPHLKYSFERLPCSESWYEVFTRQDNGTEKMFEFFGSTAYRKLPYEMGPIPFSYTSSGSNNSCRLCHQLPTATETENHLEKEGEDIETEMVVSEQDIPQLCSKINCKNEPPADPPPSKFEQEQPHAYHKHKKHHLYRYRQEQEQLQKQTFKEELSVLSHSKDSTPDPAESTLSNSSSCPSNLSCTSSKKIRNKFLNKSTFLNLDLPPRKSPREHASTLAILSCIIKQRQDSLSKPSSDVDGPSPVPTTPGAVVEEKPLLEPSIFQQALPSTRKQSTTPIEEMRFVSEISENVKRLRRGVNKYDEVPLARSLNVRQLRVLEHQKGSAQAKMKKTPKFIRDHSKSRKNNRRQNCTPAMLQYRSPFEFPPQVKRSLTAKKKTGLEFELDASALKALEKTMQETSATQLEREIDHYLEMSAFNVNEQSCETVMDIETPPESENSGPMVQKRKKSYKIPNNKPRIDDCFSSDVDLIDLIENPINGSDEDCDDTVSRGFDVGITESCATRLRDRRSGGRQSIFNFFSSSQNYFKKRKYLKANRTGWPKNKKKITARQQFQQDIKNETIRISCEGSDHLAGEGEEGPEKREHSKNSRCVVITPPDTDIDDTLLRAIASNTSSIPDEEEIDEVEVNEKVSCTRETNDDDDGYEEEEEDEDDAATAEGDEEQMEATPSSTTTLPPAILCKEETMTTNPSTPLINGYISPSEKADNSDIFTVSSDGLETDLDLSNSQLNKTVEIDGGEDIAEGERTLGSALRITSSSQKKKLDVSKLAISNNRRTMTTTYPSTTTATVATNPTTLAISNILKKEVKVSCRRLRAPFCRYRYRR